MIISKRTLQRSDVELLMYLWRWKLATTATLILRAYSDITDFAAYKKLLRLEKEEWIRIHPELLEDGFVWTLTKKGFGAIQHRLPELEQEGFASEHATHDLVCSAVHQGEFFFRKPEGVELFTEQELRRYPIELYPDWVPKNPNHRPDGYWYVPVGNPMATVALEVELSSKKLSRYDSVAEFYRHTKEIKRVLWLTGDRKTANSVYRRLHASSPDCDIHNFILYEDFVKLGWQAPIFRGPEVGKRMDYLLGNQTQTNEQAIAQSFLLDLRKSHNVSKHSMILDLSPKSD